MTTWRRFVRFQVVGAAGIGVQLAVLAALVLVGLPLIPATLLAVLAALGHNFAWHRVWTWSDRRAEAWLRQFASFVAANGLVSLVGNVVLTSGLVAAIGMSPVPANMVAIVACGGVNYWLGDQLVFQSDL